MPAVITLRVVPGQPAEPVLVPVGGRIVVHFPPNPLGTWTAPEIDQPDVLVISTDRSTAGMVLTVSAHAPGTALVTVHTTPSGDPRPPGRRPAMTWTVRVTVV